MNVKLISIRSPRSPWATAVAWLAFLAAAGLSDAEAGPAAAAEDEGETAHQSRAQADSGQVVLYYFGREACPHCRRAENWLEPMAQRHPELGVRSIDIDEHANRRLFVAMMSEREETPSAVPAFIVTGSAERGDSGRDAVWVGFSEAIAAQIQAEVGARLAGEGAAARDEGQLDFGWLGTVDLGAQPMLVATFRWRSRSSWEPWSRWASHACRSATADRSSSSAVRS